MAKSLPFNLVDKETRGILKYGDVVSFFMDPSVSLMKSDGGFCNEAVTEGGFLTAEGLVDDSLSMEQLYSVEKPEDILPPPNFRDCLFRLWPAFTYSMQEEYLHYVNQREEQNKSPRHQVLNGNESESHDARKAQLERQKNAEQEQNYEELKQAFCTPLKYGDVVQLQHIKSGKFVTLFPRLVSDKDPSCLSVQLNESGNENSWIVLIPHLQHRSIGADIEVGDQLSITFKTQDGGQLNATIGNKTEKIKDVNLSANHNMAWKVLRYYDAPSADAASISVTEKQGLRVGQMVLLKFPQAKSYLTASAERFGHAKVYFQELKMVTSSMSNSPLNSSSNIIWVVQREFSHFGRDADWNMTFFLRHFNTGYYLSFDSAKDSLFMSQDRKQALHVRLERTTNKHKQDIIQDNSTLYIGNGKGYVCMSEKDFSQVVFDSSGEAIHEASFILDALKDSEVKDMEYCLMISRRLGEMAKGFANKTNTDVEDWSKVSADVSGGDLRNLLSLCVDYCIRLVCFLTSDPAVHETITSKYPDFERRARLCVTYLRQITAASDARQVLMREQGLFYHCFSILISVGNGLDKIAGNKKYFRHSNDLRCIGFLLYSTIQLGCKNHRENESYVAKLEVTDALTSTKTKNTLDIMIEHLDLDIGAPETLSALINDNKALLEKEIHEDRLDEFCNVIADRGLRPVYLNIFAAVCGYGGVSLPKKQIAVSKKLFSSSAYANASIFFDTVVLDESRVLEPFTELLQTYGGKNAALYDALFVNARSYDGRTLQQVGNVKGWRDVVHEVPADPGIKFIVPMNIVNLPTDEHVQQGKVNMRTYWQAAEERENSDPVALNLCDNEGGGAYELYVVGNKLDTAFLSASMPSFQELYTWYELDGVTHFVYPCELEEGSPGCARFLSEFKVPKIGDKVVYRDHRDEGAKAVKKRITAVHRAWIKCKLSKSKTSAMEAAVPLRLLQHLGTKSPRMCKGGKHSDPHKPPDRVTQYMQQYYEYYLAQLHLFREMTYNRNYFGIEKIQQMFSLEEVLSGMNMVHQPEVRRHFCDLMMSVYVDSKDQQALKIPFNARPWQVLDDNDVLPSCKDDAQFAMLQAFVEQYLETKNPGWDNKESTKLTISVLQLCDLLFKFGFYSSTREIGKVNISLLKGMNPNTDKITLKSSNHRSKYQDMSAQSYYDDKIPESGNAEVNNGPATEKSLTAVMLEFLDGVPYAVFILIPTLVSTLVAIIEIIFAVDDSTIDNVIRFEDSCIKNPSYCASSVAMRVTTLICTIIFFVDVVMRLSLMGYRAYFLSLECVIDILVTAIDIIFLIMEYTNSGISEPQFKIILLLRLVRIVRVVSVRIRRIKREQQNELETQIFLRPDVNDFFRDRAEDVENETTVMLTKPKLMSKYSKVDDRYSPRGKGDLVFQVKNLQVQLLTRVQNLEAEYHVLQLFNNMKRIIEPDGAELDNAKVKEKHKELIELFATSWRNYPYKSVRDVQVAEDLDQNKEELEHLQKYLLDLILFTDKRLVESSLNLLLLSSRTKKNLVFLAKTTNLLVGSELCDKYVEIRDLRLECQTVMDSFENWGFIRRGGESSFLEKISFLDLKFHRMARLNSLEGTELQVALIDEGIIDLLRAIIEIPNRYRGIGYTKFYENNQDSFYISADIKKKDDEYARLLKNIELNMLGMFRSLNMMLLSLLGRRKSERNKRVQAKIFGLINDLLPWVGTVELTEQVIIQAVSGNRDLCNAIDDKFIKDCAMQFNDQDNPKLPKKDPIPIMLVISKISYQPGFLLPRNQKRLVAELCKTKQMEKFLTDQVEQTYHAPESVSSKWIAQREELLHMVAHLCVGEINITEAKMLELVDFGRVLSAVLADNGQTWKTTLCFLDLFYHMVIDAELKIGALGQHPNLAKLLTLFSNQLAVLCGWFEDSNYPQFKPGELLQLLNEIPDIFEGDIFQPYHPSFVSGTRSIGDPSDPIVLIRYSVFFIARMCKRLFMRYGEDLANLNSKAIRDITYCAEVLRNIFDPGKFDSSKVVSKAVLKFCLAMEELHVETKFITSGYRGGAYTAKFEALLQQDEERYSAHDFDIFCIPRPLWTTYWNDLKAAEEAAKEAKKAGKTKTKQAKSDPGHETKSESKSNRDETAYRKRVASIMGPFIKNVRDDTDLKKLQTQESNDLLLSLMETLKKRGDLNEANEEQVSGISLGLGAEKSEEKEDVKTLPNFIFCVVQHLRNALKPTRQLGRRKIFLAKYTDETTLLYSIKLFTTLMKLLRKKIPKDIFEESSKNVIDGLIECEILEFCFEMMPHGISRKFRVRNNTLKLLHGFLEWGFDSKQIHQLQERCISIFSKEGDAMSRSASFFFGVEDIFTKAIHHIRSQDFDDNRSNYLTELDSVCGILKLLLHGQREEMQGLIHDQKNFASVEDVNVLYLVTKFLKTSSRELIQNDNNKNLRTALHIIVKVMEVITEAVQGPCTPNQDYIHRSSFLESVNRILRRFSDDFDLHDSDEDKSQKKQTEKYWIITEMRVKLKHIVFTTLIAMLEGRQDDLVQITIIDKFGVENILDAISEHIIRSEKKQRVGWYFENHEHKYLSSRKITKDKQRPLFNPSEEDMKNEYKPIYADSSELEHAMKECAETAGILWMKLKAADEDLPVKKLNRRLQRYFDQPRKHGERKHCTQEQFTSWIDNTMQIVQVVWNSREGELLLQEPFPLPELAPLTNRDTFNDMLQSADRSTTKDKLNHFLDYIDVLYQEVVWEETVRKIPVVKFLCKTGVMNIFYKLFVAIAVLVLGLIVLSYRRDLEIVQEYGDMNRFQLTYGSGIKAFTCRFTEYTWWLQDICPVVTVLCWVLAVLSGIVGIMQIVLNCKPLFHKKKKNMLMTVLSSKGYAVFRFGFTIWIASSGQPESIILVIFFEYLLNSESAQTVLKSVWEPLNEIISTFMLILAAILLFSIFVFQFFHKEFVDNHLVCQTLATCFLECINYGMRNGGGVGDSLFAHDFEWHLEHWVFRVVLDLLFFLIINIILLNVVFGIIIDKFGDFRDKSFERTVDMENTCFICGKSRAQLSLYVDYNDHVDIHHKVLSYWHFILYIKNKKGSNKMTGLQQYVDKLVDEGSWKWFPINRALVYEKTKKRVQIE